MRVVVVGAGLTGLYAARLLERAGCQVHIWEARGRIGGRIQTVFEGPSRYDAGGEFIDSDHRRFLALAEELQITLEPSGASRRYWFQGEFCTSEDLDAGVRKSNEKFEARASELLRYGVEADQSLADLIDESAVSERGNWYLTAVYRSDEGEEPAKVGLDGWLHTYSLYQDREGGELSAYRVAGGMGVVTAQLFNSLRQTQVELNTVLNTVSQQEGKIALLASQGGDLVGIECDHVVLTLPVSVLPHIVFDGCVPVEQMDAFRACGLSRTIKVCLTFELPWWEEEGWSGQALFDGPLQQCWPGSREGLPVLTFYICGDDASFWREQSDPVQGVLDELCHLHPKARSSFVEGRLFDWIGDDFARGGFSYLPPGFTLRQRELLRESSGSVHFAGEHTGTWMGFFEGCLESAERVVKEIINDMD